MHQISPDLFSETIYTHLHKISPDLADTTTEIILPLTIYADYVYNCRRRWIILYPVLNQQQHKIIERVEKIVLIREMLEGNMESYY